jgi:3-keto steroid reductase
LGIGTRLIDEFLQTRPQTESLVLIITTRDQRKGDATIAKLERYLRRVCEKHEHALPGIANLLQNRVYFRQERLDLLSYPSDYEKQRPSSMRSSAMLALEDGPASIGQ